MKGSQVSESMLFFFFANQDSVCLPYLLSIKGRKHGLLSFTSGGNRTMRIPPFSFLLKEIIYSQT